MKQLAKWMAVSVTGAAALATINSANAQSATGSIAFSSITPDSVAAYYAAWSGAPTITTSTATGFEISSVGYGSLYYANPAGVPINAADTQVTLTFTLNGPAGGFYVGVPFILNDNAGPNNSAPYGGYSTFTFPGTYSETVPLTADQLTAVQTGNDAIYGFNLEFDPAGNTPGNAYDITFNSLTLSAAAAPEPGTMALFGLGAAGLAVLRRRKK
jgi:hypothetical protein